MSMPAIPPTRDSRFFVEPTRDGSDETDSLVTDGSEIRGAGEQDRDRILYTSALRRLQGVTQVVSPGEGHIFHNRLTHTLKVAQVSRSIVNRLLKFDENSAESDRLVGRLGGLDPYVVEAAALVHDLGHPPFGHVAEEELDHLIVNEGVEDGYNGNAQSFRIATRISVRSMRVRGQNLTCATLNGVLKYPWMRQPAGDHHHRWGAYKSEQDIFEWARQLHPNDERRTIEAEIMDWADDITYSVHDMEDFYRAGKIPLDRLIIDRRMQQDFFDRVEQRWTEREKRRVERMDEYREMFIKLLSRLPIFEPYQGTREQRSRIRLVSDTLIERYVQAIRLNPEAVGTTDLRHKRVIIDPNLEMEVKMLKELTWVYVITNPAMARQQHGERKIIRELFEIFLDAAQKEQYDILPIGCQENVQHIHLHEHRNHSVDDREHLIRHIVDAIAQMTDLEAWLIHRRITGVDSGLSMDYRSSM